MKPVIIGTRGSPLALAQTRIVHDLLQRAWPSLVIQTRIIKTSGDIFQTISLAANSAGKGLFTKEIEEQLLSGTIDIAVHSLKDLPTTLPDGLVLSAVPPRDDARDVLISKQPTTLASLPTGAMLATSSIRRKAQLLAYRPDLAVTEVRGNLDTRLRKLVEHDEWHGSLLAAAGLNRLGLPAQWTALHWLPLDPEMMLPAVGQGAIACETRVSDADTCRLLQAIDHPPTYACVTAERAFLRALGGGCQVPFAGHATIQDDVLTLRAAKFDHDGSNAKRATIIGSISDPIGLGEQAARRIV